jgi:hypothetical protein
MQAKALLLGLLTVFLSGSVVLAVPTRITVRVKTKDAKFLGTSMGGALITIKDARTGELLASGHTAGGTGNTTRILGPTRRGEALSDETAAHFTTTIDLDAPRRLKVTAYGPLAAVQAANTVSATQWVVPGKHITGGDAWMLELPGFAVEVLDPPTHMRLKGVPQTITLEANVTMM